MNREKIRELENIIEKEYNNTAGIVVKKDGKVLYEKYFHSCTCENQIHVFSVTKSVISILIGIALDKGNIKSIDQKVLDFFPEYTVKKREKTIQDITVRDLLTMTAPYKYKWNPYKKYFTSTDWVKFSLDLLGGKGHRGDFRYAPLIGPDILSGILVNVTGQSVFDFATKHLFSPLDIKVEKNITFHSKKEQMNFYRATNLSGWVASLYFATPKCNKMQSKNVTP